jgi:hypothetical protein
VRFGFGFQIRGFQIGEYRWLAFTLGSIASQLVGRSAQPLVLQIDLRESKESTFSLSDPIQPEFTWWPDLIATSVDRIRSRGVEAVQIRSELQLKKEEIDPRA